MCVRIAKAALQLVPVVLVELSLICPHHHALYNVLMELFHQCSVENVKVMKIYKKKW